MFFNDHPEMFFPYLSNAIKAIKENGSPLPLLLTDEECSFFSVIIPIHEAFLGNGKIGDEVKSSKVVAIPKRRTKEQIKTLILDELTSESISANMQDANNVLVKD